MLSTLANIDLVSPWNSLIGTIESISGVDALLKIASLLGIFLIVASIIGYFWKRRKGGAGGMMQGFGNEITGSLIAGIILISPKVLIPLILFILQTIINIFISVFNQNGVG